MPRHDSLWLLALSALACERCEAPNPYATSLELLPPVATDEAIVWGERGRGELIFVAPGKDGLDVRRTPLGDETTQLAWTLPTRDRGAVLALTVPASAKEEDVEETLHLVPASGEGEPTTYPVRAPFTAAALSPDHRRAVLFFGGAAASEPLHNANQVALVDLTGDQAVNATLAGFGGALRAVEFPGQVVEGEPAPVTIGGVQRDVVAFLAASEVVLMDMDDPELDQVAVPLGEDLGFSPSATLLRLGDALFTTPALFVRAQAGPEVAMLTLLDEPGGGGFTAQISLLSVGGGATDFVTYNSATTPYLLSVDAPGQALVFTDVRTQGGLSIGADAEVERVFLRDHEGDRQAVAWARGGTALVTLALAGLEDSLGRKPRLLKVETGVDDLVRLGNDRALIGSGDRLYVIDFATEQVTPLSAESAYDPGASALLGERLILGTPGQPWISTVDLQTLGPESMLLDDAIEAFFYLAGPNKVVVTHEDPAGALTLVDPADPARPTSRVHWGFLLQGALDRE